MLEDLSNNSVDIPLHMVHNHTVYTRRILYKTFVSNFLTAHNDAIDDWLTTEEGQWCKKYSIKLMKVGHKDIYLDGVMQVVIGYISNKHWTIYLLKFK